MRWTAVFAELCHTETLTPFLSHCQYLDLLQDDGVMGIPPLLLGFDLFIS